MEFIQRFIDFTSEYESPTAFWRWSAYALVAAVLRDSCYYPHGIRKTYPNIYVVLLAESAEFRKSGPFSLVSELVTELKNTKIIEGRASVQGIIDELAQDFIKSSTHQVRGGSAVIVADELAAFFVQDPQLIPLITAMYDFKTQFPYKLRSANIIVKNLCLTMLAASNSTFLREVYTTAAKYGGLLGRTLMVKPDETRPPNDLLSVDIEKYTIKSLAEYLHKIKDLKGEFTATDKAKSIYKEWYIELYKSYKKYPDSTGLTQRIHSNVLKLAMILAASDLTLIIEERHISEAIYQVTILKPNYEAYIMSTGKSDQAQTGAILLNALWEAKDHTLTRKQFLFKHWNECPAQALDELLVTLEQAGLTIVIASSNEVAYQMTPKCISLFDKK